MISADIINRNIAATGRNAVYIPDRAAAAARLVATARAGNIRSDGARATTFCLSPARRGGLGAARIKAGVFGISAQKHGLSGDTCHHHSGEIPGGGACAAAIVYCLFGKHHRSHGRAWDDGTYFRSWCEGCGEAHDPPFRAGASIPGFAWKAALAASSLPIWKAKRYCAWCSKAHFTNCKGSCVAGNRGRRNAIRNR